MPWLFASPGHYFVIGPSSLFCMDVYDHIINVFPVHSLNKRFLILILIHPPPWYWLGDHFVYVPSQWETTLYIYIQCNVIFHWHTQNDPWLTVNIVLCFLIYIQHDNSEQQPCSWKKRKKLLGLGPFHNKCWWVSQDHLEHQEHQ